MRKLLFTIAIFFHSFIVFSQNYADIDISAKEYKKIVKKLDLKVLNRGFDGSGKIWVKLVGYSSNRANNYTKFWNEALFEMDIPTGQIVEMTDDKITIDADWIFEIKGIITANGYGMEMVVGGGFSGKILDFSNNNKISATFTTKEKMNFTTRMDDGFKRSTKFKNVVKVIINEILASVK